MVATGIRVRCLAEPEIGRRLTATVVRPPRIRLLPPPAVVRLVLGNAVLVDFFDRRRSTRSRKSRRLDLFRLPIGEIIQPGIDLDQFSVHALAMGAGVEVFRDGTGRPYPRVSTHVGAELVGVLAAVRRNVRRDMRLQVLTRQFFSGTPDVRRGAGDAQQRRRILRRKLADDRELQYLPCLVGQLREDMHDQCLLGPDGDDALR